MIYVYVAGPYTNPDPVINTRNAIEAGNLLVQLGYAPYIPHLTLFWHLVFPHGVDFWYDFDLHWLRKCDALLRLPGESSGADKEEALAEELGIPVFYSVESLQGEI